ncbi:MAG: glycosyltransferase family 2 protein [Bdellovibrionales bacterium]|nr:glycosyltransferase family 2 protein [Bdellovibrionales bacterium]
MIRLPLTVTIITRNEEHRIAGAIESVKSFASEIIVIDSESTDKTSDIARASGAKVITQKFLGYGAQKNFAQDQASYDWVLSLDADEKITPDLAGEIVGIFKQGLQNRFDGFRLPRKTLYLNRWIYHGGWYPNYQVRLANRKRARWDEPEIHESWIVKGEILCLKHPIEHFSFPRQRSHILKNIEYAEYQRRKAIRNHIHFKLQKLILKPFWKFFDMYFLRAGFMDGLPGFIIAIHSAYAMFLSYSYLYESSSQDPHSR